MKNSNELIKPIENDGNSAYWKTQEAIQAYRDHVAMRQAVPKNHTHWMREFESHFKDKNIAEISPAEIEGFLFANWGECERSTWNQTKAKISGFYSFAIKELKRKGSPSFHNPCDLIDDQKHLKRKKHEFLHIPKMRELLKTFSTPSHWLWFHIMVTAGLRVSELTELRPMDVSGRILTLGGGLPCKSGRPFGEEEAVIPQVIADRLKDYMAKMSAEERIFKISHTSIGELLSRRCKKLNIDHMSANDMREWCSSFWDENNDSSMLKFVVRPMIDSRSTKYVTELSVPDVMERQDLIMVPVLFGDSPTGYTHTHDFFQATDSKPNSIASESLAASQPKPSGGDQEQTNNTGFLTNPLKSTPHPQPGTATSTPSLHSTRYSSPMNLPSGAHQTT